jgi:hypothetical protein
MILDSSELKERDLRNTEREMDRSLERERKRERES